jgi:hypothetical protein
LSMQPSSSKPTPAQHPITELAKPLTTLQLSGRSTFVRRRPDRPAGIRPRQVLHPIFT